MCAYMRPKNTCALGTNGRTNRWMFIGMHMRMAMYVSAGMPAHMSTGPAAGQNMREVAPTRQVCFLDHTQRFRLQKGMRT